MNRLQAEVEKTHEASLREMYPARVPDLYAPPSGMVLQIKRNLGQDDYWRLEQALVALSYLLQHEAYARSPQEMIARTVSDASRRVALCIAREVGLEIVRGWLEEMEALLPAPIEAPPVGPFDDEALCECICGHDPDDHECTTGPGPVRARDFRGCGVRECDCRRYTRARLEVQVESQIAALEGGTPANFETVPSQAADTFAGQEAGMRDDLLRPPGGPLRELSGGRSVIDNHDDDDSDTTQTKAAQEEGPPSAALPGHPALHLHRRQQLPLYFEHTTACAQHRYWLPERIDAPGADPSLSEAGARTPDAPTTVALDRGPR